MMELVGFRKIWMRIVAAAIAATCAGLTTASLASAQDAADERAAVMRDDIALARRYVAAMTANDHAAQAALLAPDAVFEDPTTTVVGRDAIVAGWGGQRIRILGVEEESVFHSGRGTVLMAGMTRFEQTFATSAGADVTLAFNVRTAMALTVADGLVTRHIDYVDIDGFMAQLQAHIARLRSK